MPESSPLCPPEGVYLSKAREGTEGKPGWRLCAFKSVLFRRGCAPGSY